MPAQPAHGRLQNRPTLTSRPNFCVFFNFNQFFVIALSSIPDRTYTAQIGIGAEYLVAEVLRDPPGGVIHFGDTK